MKKHRVLRNVLIDLVCAGLALVVFALFHHVLPRQQQSLGIVITNPYQEKNTERDSSLALPENAMIIASAGISDMPLTASRGGRQNGGGKGQNGSSGKGGSALTEDSVETEAEEAEAETVPISEKFAEKYTDTVVVTENSYSSPDISVTVTEAQANRFRNGGALFIIQFHRKKSLHCACKPTEGML